MLILTTHHLFLTIFVYILQTSTAAYLNIAGTESCVYITGPLGNLILVPMFPPVHHGWLETQLIPGSLVFYMLLFVASGAFVLACLEPGTTWWHSAYACVPCVTE